MTVGITENGDGDGGDINMAHCDHTNDGNGDEVSNTKIDSPLSFVYGFIRDNRVSSEPPTLWWHCGDIDRFDTTINFQSLNVFGCFSHFLRKNSKQIQIGRWVRNINRAPTKVEWTKSVFCKICIEIEFSAKSLRIFLSKFQWTPRKREHQSITQSRLRWWT